MSKNFDENRIKETLRNFVSKLEQAPSVNMYLISKTTTKSEDPLYNIYTVDIDGEIPRYFREIIGNKLEELINDSELKYRKFFDMNSSSNEIRMIPVNDVDAFNRISNDLQRFVDLPPFQGIGEIKDIWAYAIEIKFSGDKLIYFRKYAASKIISRKGITTLFVKNRLNKVEGDVLAFDDSIDCVYYKSLESIMVLDKEKFENIFNFNDFYRKRSEKVLKSLSLSNVIDIDSAVILDASIKARISRKITVLSKGEMLEKETLKHLLNVNILKSIRKNYL